MIEQRGVVNLSGFIYDGQHSRDYSIVVNKKNIPLTPPIKNRLQEISGFDGAWDYGVSFEPRPIEVECTILAGSKSDLKNKMRKLASLLNPRKGARPLIFDDDPDVMYFARLSNQIPLEQLGAMGTFTLQFICPDPFTYAVNERIGNFVNDISITHNGTWVARPVLTVTHKGGDGEIKNKRPDNVIETLKFKENSPAGEYVINCKDYTITKAGEPAYDYVEGDFISLVEGTNMLTNLGNIERTRIVFRDTWL